MKSAMALLRQEQKDGHSQLFHWMYSFQITQDKNKEEAGGEARWEKEKDWAEDDRVSAEKRTELWSILEFCAL